MTTPPPLDQNLALDDSSPRRPWLRPVLGCFVVFALAGAAMAFLFFARWTDVTDARQAEADLAFAAAIAEAGGGPPYVEIAPDGTVLVHREQESPELKNFNTLTMLAWSPADEKILRLDYPHWFVRLKTASSLNLGTMIAAVRRDWGQLDLSISYHDLRRRGPALVLDHRLENGARIVLLTTADAH